MLINKAMLAINDKNKPGAIISVSGLIKKFGNFTAVNGISFAVARGSIFAFLGPNGAGKSTTIKILTTLLRPDGGSLSIGGFDPVQNPNETRSSFGVIFQDPSLDDELTAYENMELHAVLYGVPKEVRESRIPELLNFIELWERKDELVKFFSGGTKRRLEIARGLIHHPKILFLDEPTLGLDPQTRNHIWTYVEKLNKEEGMTIFFTTHYMEEADRVAGRIAVIDHGKIVAEGSSADLKKRTNAASLEDAFLALTGKNIREEESTGTERMRLHRKLWRGR